jgi:two-component system, LytTR family, sensor kinase
MGKLKFHLLIWFIYTLFAWMLEYMKTKQVVFLPVDLAKVATKVWVFYSMYFFFKWSVGTQKRKFVLSVANLLVVLVVAFALQGIMVWIGELFGKPVFKYYRAFVVESLVLFVIFTFYGFAYFLALQLIEREKTLRLVEKERDELKKALLTSENQFLRAQINPHFLFNTLNHFLSVAQDNGVDELEKGIVQLSEMMQYAVRDYSSTNNLTLLQEEMEQVNRMIGIHQMRFHDGLSITAGSSGNIAQKQVLAMMIITLVENMFKHGDLRKEQTAASVFYEVKEAEQMILVRTVNKRKKNWQHKAPLPGIGLANIKKRLQLFYPGMPNLLVIKDEDPDIYEVELRLPYTLATQAKTSTDLTIASNNLLKAPTHP